jgi:hypothetical protein
MYIGVKRDQPLSRKSVLATSNSLMKLALSTKTNSVAKRLSSRGSDRRPEPEAGLRKPRPCAELEAPV